MSNDLLHTIEPLITEKNDQKTTHNQELVFDKLVQLAEQKQMSPLESTNELELHVVEEMNKKHAAVHTSQFYILTEKPHALFRGKDFTLESKQSFLNTYENQLVSFPDGKQKSKARIWLTHPNRRQFNGITFDPTTREHKNDLYNIWQGFSIIPRDGKCNLFKEHLQKVICSGNNEYYEYLLNWMAHLIQRPQALSPGLVLMGEQGVGKNTVVDTLGMIFGQHYLPLDNIEQFLGHFNFHLKNAVLIHGNEAIWGGNKGQLGKLKAMVTEQFCIIEGKGKDHITMRNFKHLILSSNEDWPVHLDRDDRRFLTLKVSNTKKNNPQYFCLLYEELNNGGREAFLYEMLKRDLSMFDVWRLPQNIDAFEIKMKSATSTEQYIFKVLYEGGFDIGKATQMGAWANSHTDFAILSSHVYADYTDWCAYQKIRQEDERSLGRTIHRLIPDLEKSRSREHDRKAIYYLPPLIHAKNQFQRAYNVGEAIWS